MKELKEYSVEKLKRLYSRFELWAITDDFINLRRTSKVKSSGVLPYFNCGVELENKLTKAQFDQPAIYNHLLWMSGNYWQHYFNMKVLQDPKEKFQERVKAITYDWCYNIFEFFLNPFWNLEEENKKYLAHKSFKKKHPMLHSNHPDYPRFCTTEEYNQWFEDFHNGEILSFIEELHMNDRAYFNEGMATDSEVFYFIWETLRYLSGNELKKIKKYAKDDWEIKKRGGQPKKLPIYKYDLKWNLITTYKDRKECMEEDKIPGSKLSNIINGKQRQYKGFRYTEGKKIGH